MNRFKYITTLAAGAALVCSSANAESFFAIEAGVGFVHSVPGGDGLWMWDGGSHTLEDNNVGFRGGLQLNLAEPDHWIPGVRTHLTYYNFGRVNWSANAGEDANASHTMGLDPHTHTCYSNNCGAWRNFTSSGSMQAIALTVEPYWRFGSGWTVGLEIGPAFFRSTWTSVATALSDGKFGPAGSQQTFERSPRWQFGQIAGLSVGKGPFTARVNYLRAPVDHSTNGTLIGGEGAGGGQWVPSGIQGQWMLSLNYAF